MSANPIIKPVAHPHESITPYPTVRYDPVMKVQVGESVSHGKRLYLKPNVIQHKYFKLFHLKFIARIIESSRTLARITSSLTVMKLLPFGSALTKLLDIKPSDDATAWHWTLPDARVDSFAAPHDIPW
jgi:hypothetical protein